MNRAAWLSGASFAESEIRPLCVGRRIWIGPAGAPSPGNGELLPIWLTPGPAFGTGAHPTTQLCLRALERRLRPGARVLDLGTGAGILAIAAARLGAEVIRAIDTDPEALEVARENVLHNKVARQVQLENGTLSDVLVRGDHPFDWVIANILAHVLVGFFEQGLPQVVAPGGWLVLSGFLRSQTPPLRAALTASRLELLAEEQQDEWICIIAQRPA